MLLKKRKNDFGRDVLPREVAASGFQYAESMTTAALAGNGQVGARSRQIIYAKYQQMMADPLVSGALRLHATAALGGHETSGDVVFIEASADAPKKSQAEKLVKELTAELGPIFNRIAMPITYNGLGFGDAYGRIYTAKGVGVRDVLVDEMLLPPLVIPYEQGSTTRVCEVAIGPRMQERLVMDQIVRLKMPRMIYTPQPLAVEKAMRAAIAEDDMDKLELRPSIVGGSFLADAETQFNNYIAALMGLVGQRVLDSIDESIMTAEVAGMTKEQQQQFLSSIRQMFKRSKQIAEDAVKTGRPLLTRIRHVLPVASAKQLLGIQGVNSAGGSGTGRAGNIGIEDVMLHAKLLCGALGIDISMLGFADLMSGGLGDGGFFRTSAQAAERSRSIRMALTDFFNHIIDVHLIYKQGYTFEPNERPWTINFYGTISALETERQKTQMEAMQTGALMLQAFQQAKELGLDEKALTLFLEKILRIDTDEAKTYAKAIIAAPDPNAGGFGGGPGDPGAPGGGFEDGGDGNEPVAPRVNARRVPIPAEQTEGAE